MLRWRQVRAADWLVLDGVSFEEGGGGRGGGGLLQDMEDLGRDLRLVAGGRVSGGVYSGHDCFTIHQL